VMPPLRVVWALLANCSVDIFGALSKRLQSALDVDPASNLVGNVLSETVLSAGPCPLKRWSLFRNPLPVSAAAIRSLFACPHMGADSEFRPLWELPEIDRPSGRAHPIHLFIERPGNAKT
jgi:hypothetical protein